MSFLLGEDKRGTVEVGEDKEESLLAAAACSGVLYFLGLPLFLRTPVCNGEETADGTEL